LVEVWEEKGKGAVFSQNTGAAWCSGRSEANRQAVWGRDGGTMAKNEPFWPPPAGRRPNAEPFGVGTAGPRRKENCFDQVPPAPGEKIAVTNLPPAVPGPDDKGVRVETAGTGESADRAGAMTGQFGCRARLAAVACGKQTLRTNPAHKI